MAIPQHRDADTARRALTGWLERKLPSAERLAIEVGAASEGSGFSSDTIIFDATWIEAGHEHREGFVVRATPLGEALFRSYELDLQFDIVRALGERSNIPVPRVRWYEADDSILGAPFFAMQRLDGRVPSDNPPYTMGGWLFDASADEQRRAFVGGADLLTEIAKFDWRGAGLTRLDRVELGATPGEQLFRWQRDFYEWAARKPVAVLEHAWTWLDANRPHDDHLATLCWGDARLANLMFDATFNVQAVLDWEMARIGNPEFDLAWYLWFDKHFSAGIGMERLRGFPADGEVIARWEDQMGRTADHLEYYTVFTMVFFAGIMMRVVQSHIAHGANPDDFGTMETNNICTQMLAQHFGFPAPD